MSESAKLLADYSKTGSEQAFRELVAAYLNLVYSTAIRLVGGDAHLAEDVAQMVFVDLARKARTLPGDVMLGGWLHRDTCFVAGKLMRGERRRQFRERQAAEMNSWQNDTEPNLAHVKPILDEAVNQLGDADRTAILLRFFEQRDLRSVGEALGSSENAAQKRVTRALEELRILLKRRGVAFTTAALGVALANEVVTAAPAGIAAGIAGTALATTTAKTLTSVGILKLMSLTKIQVGLAALLIAAATTTLIVKQQALARLRDQNQTLRGQLDQESQAQAKNDRLSGLLATSGSAEPLSNKPPSELLKLRAEVSRLRNQLQEHVRLQSIVASAANSNSKSQYVPSETWTNAGFGSPLDALQTAHWAVHAGDTQQFKDSVVITDDARQLLNGLLAKMMAKLPPDEAAQAEAQLKQQGLGVEEGLMFPMMAKDQKDGYKGYQVLAEDSSAPDETALHLQLDFNSGESQTNVMRFKHYDTGWKQVLDVTDLPADIRTEAAKGK